MSYGIWHDDAMLEEHKDLHGAMRRSREIAQEKKKWVEVRTEEGVVLSVAGPEEQGSTLHMAKLAGATLAFSQAPKSTPKSAGFATPAAGQVRNESK